MADFESLIGKGEDALGKFMDDPEKVDKAKSKAEDLLSQRIGQDKADQVVNKAEELLDNFAHRRSQNDSTPQE